MSAGMFSVNNVMCSINPCSFRALFRPSGERSGKEATNASHRGGLQHAGAYESPRGCDWGDVHPDGGAMGLQGPWLYPRLGLPLPPSICWLRH
ncbi:hypothetical protein J4Q44_G00117820 [Coregonus suidteri]|uniref:Uncharacterized protein n=1 Tax=Coregonus suidteri TaxID=861788 RepID=A0AAN8M696_9TELE